MIGTVLLSACGNDSGDSESSAEPTEGATTGGELKVAYSAQPPILDVHESSAIATSDMMRHVYESLVTVDSSYNIEPMLAESYELSEDGTAIEFVLREDVLFHNGETMTAEDVVASMDKWLDSPGNGNKLPDEATIEQLDDKTVVLDLGEPMATALPILAFNSVGFPAIMPAEIAEEADGTGVKEYIGTGPFKFDEWIQDQHIKLVKFEDYAIRDEPADGLAGAREALVDKLLFEFILDSSTRVSGMQSRQFDVAHAVPFDNADQLESDPNLTNHTYPGAYLTIHFNKREGFFTEQDARQALATSIDSEAILTGAYASDDYYVLNHNIMMYHQLEQWPSDVGQDIYNTNDPSNMDDYLSDIGYDGEEITIITTRDYEDQYNGSVVLQQQMEQMGLNVAIEVYDWPTLLEMNQDENAYDIFVLANVSAAEPGSNVFMNPDYPGWSEVPSVVDDFRASSTLEEAQDKYDEVLEWYWEYVPVVRIGDFKRVATTQEYIDNFRYQDGFVFWGVSKND
ncbi:LOW QUALITY PROTEIN: dipeptide-binding ABC transporter, periplasmic substrate-binding component [Geomicrobium sp. JCM 19055]|nr:LOW QUALITY PROTEIN: dipeptide-binding ABC transporter, periplasmic substrate-binding component [Geomicrobium sp. JCM 19055]